MKPRFAKDCQSKSRLHRLCFFSIEAESKQLKNRTPMKILGSHWPCQLTIVVLSGFAVRFNPFQVPTAAVDRLKGEDLLVARTDRCDHFDKEVMRSEKMSPWLAYG